MKYVSIQAKTSFNPAKAKLMTKLLNMSYQENKIKHNGEKVFMLLSGFQCIGIMSWKHPRF